MTTLHSSPKAVVLISGGLDSSTCLAIAKQQGYDCYGLSFDYGQRANSELDAARRVSALSGIIEHKIIKLNIGDLGGSALTDDSIDIPDGKMEGEAAEQGIPITYVPARNTVFLSYALAWAEVLSAQAIFIGVNALDYSGYPDCRPQFIEAFQQMANLATKVGVEGQTIAIEAPLIDLTKAQIIKCGLKLGVDYGLTVSCYQANELGAACGRCDSCRLRSQGFSDAAVDDPTVYA
ncbi:MAG: 7-cyano-7-deazaguanine synthase QueC [SAR86 cluster bacterium]|uniref:7-cyano-7-deazaguanine synthase n=1 Tax=SAR86 cluster bacterium TaxID=2030880 RepID=A0A2A4MT45_9GAMM|nr:MAG: 7-cyano-7-deazaguanine synthase QueC [SAR86 cluster bacterium]